MTKRHMAFVRCNKVPDADDLARLANHGRGLGKTAVERRLEDLPDDAPRAVFFRRRFKPWLGGVGCDIPQADLKAALEDHKTKHGAVHRKGTMHCMNFIVGVSSAFLDIDPDDPHARRDWRKNKRVRKLVESAIQWADHEFGIRPENGKNGVPAVFAARLDLDETGTGNVDLFLAPIRPNKRSGKLFVNCNAAKAEFAERHGHYKSMSYRAMQDSWTAFASKRLEHAFERGEAVEVSGRKHESPETMKRLGNQANPENAAARRMSKARGDVLTRMVDALMAPGDPGEQVRNALAVVEKNRSVMPRPRRKRRQQQARDGHGPEGRT